MLKVIIGIVLLFSCAAVRPDTTNSVRVIVFPLENNSRVESLSWLSEGLALSISEQIASPEVKVVSRDQRTDLVESLDLPPGAQLSRASMILVAQRASADWMISGSFGGREQNLNVSVRVLHIKSVKLSGTIAANGPLSAAPQMENELSWLILRNGGFEKHFTRESFTQRTRKVPNDAYSLFIESFKQHNQKDRIRLLLKAVDAYPNFPHAQLETGRYYFRRGDCDQALMHLSLARNGETTGNEDDYMCGVCYLKADMPDQAINALERINTSSGSYELFNNLGVAYFRKGETAPALANLIEAGKRAPSDSIVSANLAIALHTLGDYAAALTALEQAAKAHPKNGMLQFLLGMVLAENGEQDKARASMEAARIMGVNVDRLKSEEPGRWMRITDSKK